jgi:hypothetical protein
MHSKKILLCLVFAALLMKAPALFPDMVATDTVCLENEAFCIMLMRSTGTIVSFTDKAIDEDLCQLKGHYTWRSRPPLRTIAGVEVRDCLEDRVFSDRRQAAQADNWRIEKRDSAQSVSFDRKFPDANFTIQETLLLKGTTLEWEISLLKDPGAAERSVRVSYLFPLLTDPWRLWAPTSRPNRRNVHPEIPFRIRHGLDRGGHFAWGVDYAPVPMVSFFRPQMNRHLSFTVPPDVPNVLVHFTNCTGQESPFIYNSLDYQPDELPCFATTFHYLGLRDSGPTNVKLVINSGPGEFRSSLAWLRDNFSPWFLPTDKAVFEHVGFYGVSWPLEKGVSDVEVKNELRWQSEMGLSLAQTHANFPCYGCYISDDSVWQCIPHPRQNADLSIAGMRKLIRLNRQMGVSIFPYFNVVDGQREFADESFSDEIVRDALGERVNEYGDSYLMNADPELGFGRHLLKQAAAYLDSFDQVAGIYLDNAGKNYQVDFGHDDGITMIGNRPAYAMQIAFQRIFAHIDTLVHNRDKFIIGYSAENLEALKGVDVLDMSMSRREKIPMAEASRFFLLDERPSIIEDSHQQEHLELYYQYCLWLGAQPMVPDSKFEDNNLTVFSRYAPFIKSLVRRRWVLEPNALVLPEQDDLVGNLFELPGGDFVLTLASLGRSMFEPQGGSNSLSIEYNLPQDVSIGRIVVHSLDSPADSLVTVYGENGESAIGSSGRIIVPRHRSTTVIIINSTQNGRKAR